MYTTGMNQLLWYYAELEGQRCQILVNEGNATRTERPPESCHLARRFSNLFETSQTLFWAVFGLIELESFELAGIKSFTRFWGMLMFGCFSVINIVVLLNLLIVMMNHSYQLIFEKADVEWKFARSKLWISYFEEGATVPPPFNIIPTPKTFYYITQWLIRKLCRYSVTAKREHIKTVRRKHKQQSERDTRYQNIMRNLVRRYVTTEQRQADNQGVTEDDVNEIKQDISAFRCELLEVLKNSGMNTASVSGLGTGSGGKKNRQRERRLMKGFNIAPPSTTPTLSEVHELDILQENEAVHYDKKSPKTRLARLARMAGAKREMSKKKWGTIIEAARNAGMSKLVGRSRSEDSVCSNCSQGSSSVMRKLRHQPSTIDTGGKSSTGTTGAGISQSLDAGDLSEMNESFDVPDELRSGVKRTASAPTRDGSSSPPIAFIDASPGGVSASRMSKSSQLQHLQQQQQQQRYHHQDPSSEDNKTETTTTTTTPPTAAPSMSGGSSSSTRAHSSFVCVQLEPDCDNDNASGGGVAPSGSSVKPNGPTSTTPSPGESKLKGIIQPLRASSGWL